MTNVSAGHCSPHLIVHVNCMQYTTYFACADLHVKSLNVQILEPEL